MAGSSSQTADSAMTSAEWVCTTAPAPVAAYTARCIGVSGDGSSAPLRWVPSMPITQMSAALMSRYGMPDGVISTSSPTRTLMLPALPTASPSSSRRLQWLTSRSRCAPRSSRSPRWP
jgi:hypothetical protein